ncbi:MAG: tetratricopeptide repeat protein [Saprospiraceae bacterium]
MKDSKVFYTIERLSNRERSRFRKYLKSPYFNSDPKLTELYETIVKKQKAVSSNKLDKEGLWLLVRPDKNFNDVRFRKYTSDLLKHIEGFLYQEYTRQDKGHEYPFVLDALNERQMDKLYDSVLRGGRDAIEKNPRRDSKYFQRTYAIEKRFYDLSDSERRRGVAATTSDIADALDLFYIIEKLRLHCSVLVRSFYLEGDYSLRLISEIIKEVETSVLREYPVVDIYFRLIQTYTKPEDKSNYETLVGLVKSSHILFDPDELEDLYRGLLNYLNRGINRGDSKALYRVVELYDYMLVNEVFNAQGELSPWAFRNGILAGLRTEQFDWVSNTLKIFNDKLPADYRDNAVSFNYAQLYFYQKEYGRVLEYLQDVEYQDPAYSLNSRNLLVAVYYELGQIEPLYSTIHSFRTYLKRQKQLSEKVRTGYRDLLKVTQRLAKVMHGDSKKLAAIESFLDENPSTVSRQWLTTKLEELKAGKRPW